MKRPLAATQTLVTITIRAALFSLMLAAPVLAVPTTSNGQGTVIEAPARGNSGLGFVLLVSLQR